MARGINIKRFISSAMLAMWVCLCSAEITMSNIQYVDVDKVSDTELMSFVNKYTEAGYSWADVESIARAKNMSSDKIERLRLRVAQLQSSPKSEAVTELTSVEKDAQSETAFGGAVQKTSSRIYGSSIFSRSKVQFEPSQSMATPRNYVIGPQDVLHVDVYGYSEATYDLTVSSDGTVRVPNVGVLAVSGLTIESAEALIRKKLSSVISTINSGKTSVTLSMNKIRSLKVYILGEVNAPGSYTLPSVSSVFNAMNACGGPSENGSMREVKVIRGGKEVMTVDLYGFLMSGKVPEDVTLQDQDVIQVPPYGIRVTVNGAVKRDGIYEMKQGETLQDLFRFCGGFSDDAYTGRVTVTRNQNAEKSVADVPSDIYAMFTPQSGDVYQVGRILEKYTNRVQIAGSVFRPGAYALTEGMTLRDLVEKADGLTEDAFMEQATVVRLQEDLTPEIVSFSVKELMDSTFNMELRKEDVVTIGGKNEFEQKKEVSINGAVLEPGRFPYYENMTLKDLIFLARGFQESADPSKVEVIRSVTDAETLKKDVEKTMVFAFSLERDLSGEEGNFSLQPRDRVTVRTLEGYESLGYAQVTGEVRMPGHYAITNKKERVSDLMIRAGGVSDYAYMKGAFLIRKAKRTQAEQMRDLKLIEMLSAANDDVTLEKVRSEMLTRTDMVGISLDRIIRRPGCDEDLFVEEGDLIYVPKVMQTVTVAGAVQVPGKELYNGKSTRKYLRGAGGFNSNARKRGVYVAYPNGKVASTKRFLGIRNYPPVEPGSHIFVPEKVVDSKHDRETATFFATLFGSVVSMASVVVTMISVVNK